MNFCARPECGHPSAIHVGEACRIGGCRCAGFSDGSKRPAGPRRVSIDVPDGYMLSVTLTPWDPALGSSDYSVGGVASEEALVAAAASMKVDDVPEGGS